MSRLSKIAYNIYKAYLQDWIGLDGVFKRIHNTSVRPFKSENIHFISPKAQNVLNKNDLKKDNPVLGEIVNFKKQMGYTDFQLDPELENKSLKYGNPYEKLRVQFVKGMNRNNYPSDWEFDNAQETIKFMFDYQFAILLDGIK